MFAKRNEESLQRGKRNNLIFIWGVLTPILICYTVTSVFPMFFSFVLNFYNWNLLGQKTFVGLDNWKTMIADAEVWKSLKITIEYSLLCMIPSVVIGLTLAMIVNAKIAGASIFKSIYFLPVVTSWVVITGIWRWMFSAEDAGIINQLIGYLGIPPNFWLGKNLALVTLALLGIFKQVGMIMVYFYAGLKGISGDLYEAARIDGSSAFNTFVRITLPLLKPTTTYVMIITLAATMKVYDSTYILFIQSGGPENSANTLVFHIWKTAFQFMKMGYASAISMLLFLIILISSLIQYFGLKTENYE